MPAPPRAVRRLALVAAALALGGCAARPPAPDPAAARAALMEADRAFAAASAARGLDGWMEAYAADAVRLRLGEPAVRGRDAIRAFDAPIFADPDVRLEWTPTDGGAFADGRHGFTTGTSVMVGTGTPPDTLWRGRYVTLWRLEPDGRWRVLLDTGADAP